MFFSGIENICKCRHRQGFQIGKIGNRVFWYHLNKFEIGVSLQISIAYYVKTLLTNEIFYYENNAKCKPNKYFKCLF